MFAGRVPASLAPGPWARRLERLLAEGRPLLDLTDHDPTTADLGYLDAALLAPLADPAGLAHAPAFRLFGEPGARFLAPAPGYPLCELLAAAEAVAIARYPLVQANGDGPWRVDLEALGRALPGAAGVIAVHPNHPTGALLARDEAAALARLCAAADVPLLVDEVFAEFHDAQAPGARPLDALRQSFVDESEATTLVFGGLSKTCGLPQLKLAWIVVAGPPERRDEVLARLEWRSRAEPIGRRTADGGMAVQDRAVGLFVRRPGGEEVRTLGWGEERHRPDPPARGEAG